MGPEFCVRDGHATRLPRRWAARVLHGCALVVAFSLGAAVLAGASASASVAVAPVGLGSSRGFAVLAGLAVTNTGPSSINGDIGVSPGTAVTGVTPGEQVGGAIYAADAVARQAQIDVTAAYNDAAGRTPGVTVAAELGGSTLVPGVYRGPALGLTGTLTLDAGGDANAVFIVQAGGALTTAAASRVVLVNGASACNVFWQLPAAVTLGAGSTFAGTVLAIAAITAGAGAVVSGRLLSSAGAVTLSGNTVTNAGCASTVPGAPTIGIVTRGNTEVSVAFTAPLSNGGSVITGYTATCVSSDGGAAGWTGGSASPITVTGLTNGKAYTCTVTATNAVGSSVASAASNVVVPAPVPDAPTIGAVTSTDQAVIIAFAAPANDGGTAITSYIATCTAVVGGGAASAASARSPITVTGLVNGSTYTCVVHATSNIGTGLGSVASSPVIPSTVPGAPTIGVATRGNTQVSATFTPPISDGGSPVIDYSASCAASNGGATSTAAGSSSPILVTGLTNGVGYTCAVSAANAVGQGPASNASTTVTPATTPNAPTAVVAVRGDAQASVSFVAPASTGGAAIISYTTVCVSSNGGPSASVSSAGTPAVVTALRNGSTYTCTVVAISAVGSGTASLPSSSFVPATVPGSPVLGVAERGNRLILVRFTGPTDSGGAAITSYEAFCASTDGGVAGSTVGSGGPLTVSGLTNGSVYACLVRATNRVGIGPSSAASNLVIPATVPDPPAIGVAVRGNVSAMVAFTPPANTGGLPITGYTARCTSTNGGDARSATGRTSPVTVTSLVNSWSYTCSVRATNGVGTGVRSEYSNVFVPATVPGAPTNVSALPAGSGKLRGSFTVPLTNGGSPITGYAVSCASSDGGVPGSGTGFASPLTVVGLTDGRHYSCTVVAFNIVGSSARSAPTGSVLLAMVPAAPSGVSAISASTTASTGSVTVTFTAGSSVGSIVSSFDAMCISGTGGVMGTATVVSSTAMPIVVPRLTTGASYACQVRATNSTGVGSYSAVSTPLIVGSPAAPISVKALSGSTAGSVGTLSVSYVPSSANGATITSFTASCTSADGGAPASATHAGSTGVAIVVGGVTTAKSYQCSVRAVNSRGLGQWSAVSPVVIVGAPAAPTAVSAARVASGSLRVSFTPSAINGSTVTSFTAACRSSNGGTTRAASAATGPITVAGLSATMSYTCTIVAQSNRGDSAASAASASVIA